MSSQPITPALQQDRPALEERFQGLADSWSKATAHQSSLSVRHGHPAYQEIIKLGPPVVPLLLRDLEVNGRHWFHALKAITGADPVAPAERGDIDRMRDAWLRWGKESGLQW